MLLTIRIDIHDPSQEVLVEAVVLGRTSIDSQSLTRPKVELNS